MKKESEFQREVINVLNERLPGCIVEKTDPTYIQGLPDLIIFYKDRWAALECKRNRNAPKRPNQEYYVDLLNSMSYAAIIYPENKEKIIDEVERALLQQP